MKRLDSLKSLFFFFLDSDFCLKAGGVIYRADESAVGGINTHLNFSWTLPVLEFPSEPSTAHSEEAHLSFI